MSLWSVGGTGTAACANSESDSLRRLDPCAGRRVALAQVGFKGDAAASLDVAARQTSQLSSRCGQNCFRAWRSELDQSMVADISDFWMQSAACVNLSCIKLNTLSMSMKLLNLRHFEICA
jgi:hypothetical protein